MPVQCPSYACIGHDAYAQRLFREMGTWLRNPNTLLGFLVVWLDRMVYLLSSYQYYRSRVTVSCRHIHRWA